MLFRLDITPSCYETHSRICLRGLGIPLIAHCKGLNGGPQSDSPEPGDVTLFGQKVFADVMKDLEMRTSWITLNPMTSDLITDTQRRGTGRKGGQVKTEAEIGGMWPQAQEHLEPPETGRHTERWSPRACGGARLCGHLEFGLLAFRTLRE